MTQNRYVGDMGSFASLSLLRHLSKGKKLGVAWYLYPDENNSQGSLIQYLDAPNVWRRLDPELFDALKGIIIRDWKAGARSRAVADIEISGLLPGAKFTNVCLNNDTEPNGGRRQWRADWFKQVQAKLADCDLVFADPDNGLYGDDDFDSSNQVHWKRLPLREARELSDGRTTILYNHNSRFKGGNRAEIRYWMKQLPAGTYAFYWRRYNNRTYFVVNPDQTMIDDLKEFVEKLRQAESRLGIKSQKRSELIKPEQ